MRSSHFRLMIALVSVLSVPSCVAVGPGHNEVWEAKLTKDDAKQRRKNAHVGDCVVAAFPGDIELTGEAYRLTKREVYKANNLARTADVWEPCTPGEIDGPSAAEARK